MYPFEWLLEGTLGGQCIVYRGYMQKIVWSETYVHFCYKHKYKTPMIYQSHLNDGRERIWSESYIHFPITINTFNIILKAIVTYLLRPTPTSCTISYTITSFILIKTFINMTRSTRYMQQFTMVAWVIGGRVTGLGHISTSPLTTTSFYNVVRGKVDGIFKLIFTSAIVNSYSTPQVNIITNYIFLPINIIITDITLLRSMSTISKSFVFMNISIYRTRRRLDTR